MFFLNYSYVLISSFFTAPAMCRPVFSNFAFAEQKNASEAAPQGVLRGWGDRGGIGGRGEGGGGVRIFLGNTSIACSSLAVSGNLYSPCFNL